MVESGVASNPATELVGAEERIVDVEAGKEDASGQHRLRWSATMRRLTTIDDQFVEAVEKRQPVSVGEGGTKEEDATNLLDLALLFIAGLDLVCTSRIVSIFLLLFPLSTSSLLGRDPWQPHCPRVQTRFVPHRPCVSLWSSSVCSSGSSCTRFRPLSAPSSQSLPRSLDDAQPSRARSSRCPARAGTPTERRCLPSSSAASWSRCSRGESRDNLLQRRHPSSRSWRRLDGWRESRRGSVRGRKRSERNRHQASGLRPSAVREDILALRFGRKATLDRGKNWAEGREGGGSRRSELREVESAPLRRALAP